MLPHLFKRLYEQIPWRVLTCGMAREERGFTEVKENTNHVLRGQREARCSSDPIMIGSWESRPNKQFFLKIYLS